MKPIRLVIAGLHSYREAQEIRFEQLSDTGVFGIFGPTGSGKSTILDAMTLALYGTVGRAEHNTRGILNHAETSLSVIFEFEIGVKPRKRYRVERSYRRKDDIAVQNVRSRFIECDPLGDIVLADRDSDVTAQVKQVLGLEPDDFMRAVVLPQGKFAEFLNLKGADRNRMLQRLFALERFGDQLQQRLKNELDLAERDLERISAQQLGMGDASAEAIAEAEAALAHAEAAEALARDELANVRAEHERSKALWEQQRKLEEVEAERRELERDAETVRRWEASLAAADRARNVVPFIAALRESQESLTRAEAEYTNLTRQVAELQQRLEAARDNWQEAAATLTRDEPQLQERERQLKEAVRWEQELSDLERERAQYAEARDQLAQQSGHCNSRMEDLQRKIDGLKQERQQLLEEMAGRTVSASERNRWLQIRQRMEEYQQRRADLQRQSEQLQSATRRLLEHQERLAAQRQELAARENQYGQLQQELEQHVRSAPLPEGELAKLERDVQRLQILARQFDAYESQRAMALAAQADLQKQLAELEQQWTFAPQAHQRAVTRLAELEARKAEALERSAAIRLAAHLRDGEPCPVCGSAHHPRPANAVSDAEPELAELESAIAQARTEVERLARQVGELERKKIETNAALTAQQRALESAEAAIAQVQADVRAIREDAPTSSCAALQEWLARAAEQSSALSLAAKEWSDAGELLQQRLEEARQGVTSARVDVAKLETEVSRSEEEVLRQREQCAQAEQAARAAADGLQKALAAAGVDAAELSAELFRRIQDKLNEIADNDAFVEHAKEKEQAIEADLRELTAELESLQKQVAELRVQMGQLDVQIRERSERADALRQVIRERIAEGTAEAALRATSDLLRSLRERAASAEQAYRALEAEWHTVEKVAAAARATKESAQAQLQRAEAALQQKLREEQFVSVAEVEDAVLDDAEREERARYVQQYNERAKALATRYEQLTSEIGDRRIRADEWQAIQERLADAERRWRDAVGALGVARQTLEDRKARHEQWQQLEERRVERARRVEQLTTLKQLLSGNRFVEFVAEEQLEFLARQASDRLKQLTRNRYALEVGADGRFVMRDDFNGGVRRPVSTLSGGETFLTSLALALSLSMQIQLQGQHPLEFFFLDEGFGTLDPELLDVVMATLERLHLENMTIGIISHVPELRQRLQRRLIVEPAEASGRGTRLRIETA